MQPEWADMKKKKSEVGKFRNLGKRLRSGRGIGATKVRDFFMKYSAQIDVPRCAFLIFSVVLFYPVLQTDVVEAITLRAVSRE